MKGNLEIEEIVLRQNIETEKEKANIVSRKLVCPERNRWSLKLLDKIA
jgi:hypothetical protein